MENNLFEQVQMHRPRTNTFNLSHEKKLSMVMGKLIPILTLECVPGDKFSIKTSQLIRFAPLIAPVMHRVQCYTHFFFVPNRLVFDDWEDFITGGLDGTDTTAWPWLQVDPALVELGSLADYMGIPRQTVGTPAVIEVSAIPMASYGKCVADYYLDENIQTAIINNGQSLDPGRNVPLESGFISAANVPNRNWPKDYFTSALPWTQKGNEATIPLGTDAPLIFNPAGDLQGDPLDDNASVSGDKTLIAKDTGSGVYRLEASDASTSFNVDITAGTTVDLTNATAAGIIDLRRAFKLQEWLEKNARGGTRYIESILSHFGVRSSDARLQRPEFLGGATTPIQFSEVLQTSSNASEPTPQGNMAGHGIGVGANGTIKYFCEEHGYIIGIMSVIPKATYQQGVPKHFLKSDKLDYFWPSFAHIGEQPIQNQELWTDPSQSVNEDTFGYTPRYAEYKYLPSTVHGEFKESLDFWHLGRIFSAKPSLNEDFIACNPSTRIFAVTQDEQLYVHIHHSIRAERMMPYFGNPKL